LISIIAGLIYRSDYFGICEAGRRFLPRPGTFINTELWKVTSTIVKIAEVIHPSSIILR